jgi:Transposase DDE domain
VRGHAPSETQKAANTTRSNVRARVEHVFGHQENSMGGKIVRTIGIARARLKIGMMNLGYNIRRWFRSSGRRQRLLEWGRGWSLSCVAQIGLAAACKTSKRLENRHRSARLQTPTRC